MIRDQRAHSRVSFFLGGDVYAAPEGKRAGRAVIRDVSVSGLRIETLAPFAEGQTLYVDFEVAGRFQFQKCAARVMRVYKHVGSYLLGLSFPEAQVRRRMRQALAYVVQEE